MRRVIADENASKKLPLDIHHVRYVSAGGDDSLENLVPLCPLCHRAIHKNHQLGKLEATPENIRIEWDRWRSFATLEIGCKVGAVGPHVELPVDLPTYALLPRFAIGADVTYSQARLAILEAVLLTLSDADPHFAFLPPRGRVGFTQWSLSSDEEAASAWNTVAAQEVFATVEMPVTLAARKPLTGSLSARGVDRLQAVGHARDSKEWSIEEEAAPLESGVA